MGKSITRQLGYEGNLALASTQPRFRVIEGGLSQRHEGASRPMGASKDVLVVPRARVTASCAPQGPASIVVTMALTLTLVVFGVVWHATDVMTHSRVQNALADVSYQTIVVHPGDSLWGIAESHPVNGCTTSELVRHIRAINSIGDACLSVGMELSVPGN